MTTYIVQLRDRRGQVLSEDHGESGKTELKHAKQRYRRHANTYQNGGYSDEVAEVRLVQRDDRRQSVIMSTGVRW